MSFNNEGEQYVHPIPEHGLTPEHGATPGGVLQTTSGSSRKWIGGAVAAVVVVALTVGGVAVVNAMGGGGAQPEDVLPGNAMAFSKLDLNPSAGQKVAAYQLISKFPEAKEKVTSEDTSIKESIFGSAFTGSTAEGGMGLDYKKDVEPWLGDRIGVGVFPDTDGDKDPEVGVAIAFTDRDAAKAALDKAIANVTKKQADKKFPVRKTGAGGYAFAEDEYVIVSDTTAHATALVEAGKTSSLAKSTYAEDVKSLGSDQIGVAWADLAAIYKATPKEALVSGLGMGMVPGSPNGANDPSKASGRLVMGVHADSSFLEVSGKVIDLEGVDIPLKPGADSGTGLITSFPSDLFGAATITGLGKITGDLYTSYTAGNSPLGAQANLHEFGIDSGQQIETLLGTETGIMVGGTKDQPQFALRTRGGDADAALAIARKAIAASPFVEGLTASKVTSPEGIVVSVGSDLTTAISDPSGSKLDGDQAFRLVAPDSDKSLGAGYVNLAKVIPAVAENPKDAASLQPLLAMGLTTTGGAEPTFRLRLSVR